MREIKFRAWDKYTQRMNSTLSLGAWKIGPDGVMANWGDHEERENYILMQYTGLKDKNGKEIYEGDIFSFHPSEEWKGTEPDNPCVVFWSDELSAFMFYVGKPEMSTLLPPSESIEIVGNIHENPEFCLMQ